MFRKHPNPLVARLMDDRQHGWRSLAARLELGPEQEFGSRIRKVLGLAEDVRPAPVYSLLLSGHAKLVLFDYTIIRTGPTGSVRETTSVTLIRSSRPLCQTSMKATSKLGPVLASLEASAIGGEIMAFAEDPDFDTRVTVFARDTEVVRGLVTGRFRDLLLKALTSRRAAATCLLGEHHLLFSAKGRAGQGAPFEVIEDLTSDLLSVYATFSVAGE